MGPVNSSLAQSVLRDPRFKIDASNNSKDGNIFHNNLREQSIQKQIASSYKSDIKPPSELNPIKNPQAK